jgi:hypothetical protein
VKIGITVGVVIAILALVVCLVPLKEVAYTATVDYQDTETYYEDEPVTETYYETVNLQYAVNTRIAGQEAGIPSGQYLIVVEITNTDTVSGYFSLNWLCLVPTGLGIAREGLPYTPGRPQLLAPGETMHQNRLTNIPEIGDYSIETSTKSVEKTRILGTQQVEKQRTVTKQRPETRYKKVTLLDYFLHY